MLLRPGSVSELVFTLTACQWRKRPRLFIRTREAIIEHDAAVTNQKDGDGQTAVIHLLCQSVIAASLLTAWGILHIRP